MQEVPVYESIRTAEQVVSCAKFKTHDLAIVTGGMKNFFGIIPTTIRSTFHTSSSFAGMFNEMLVDVFSAVQPPPLVLTDGVVGMEGKGPIDGRQRKAGVIMASCDCVAHDAVMAAMMGLDPMDVPMVRLAHKAKLGQGLLETIEVRGAAIDEVRMDDWDVYGDNNKLKKHAVG